MATLDTVINETMLAARDKDSLIFGKGKPLIVQVAKRGLQELYFSVAKQVRILAADLPESNMIKVPVDYVTLVRLSIMGFDNKLTPIYYDARQPIQYEYLRSNTGQFTLDPKSGLPFKTYTKTPYSQVLEFSASCNYTDGNYGNCGPLYGMRGGYETRGGKYRWDPEARVWHFEDVVTDKVFIEYISDPLARLDNDTIEVDELFVECLKAYIVYTLVKNDRNMPMGRIDMAKKEYFTLKKKGKMRQQMDAPMLMQAARTQRGSFKF